MIGKNPSFAGRNAAIYVSQVFIYNRALTDAEIARNYSATKSRYTYKEDIIRDNLILNIDPASALSYPGSGTVLADMSGYNYHPTLVNGPTLAGSGLTSSILLDGSNDYILVNSQANILSKTAYTKIAYIYISNFSTVNNIISGGFSGQHAFWMFATNKLNAGHNGAWNTVVGATSLSLNTWYFAAVTYNNSTGWKLYLNGVEDGTSANTTTFTGNQEIVIGAYSSGNNFTGRIASVQVYNRVLSASEIVQNYNATKRRYGL